MKGSTDAARAAADIVLTSDGLAVLIPIQILILDTNTDTDTDTGTDADTNTNTNPHAKGGLEVHYAMPYYIILYYDTI